MPWVKEDRLGETGPKDIQSAREMGIAFCVTSEDTEII